MSSKECKVSRSCSVEKGFTEQENGCSAVTLSGYYLNQLKDGSLNRILFVPTGALLSTVSFNEGQTVPGIAHGVVIEHV